MADRPEPLLEGTLISHLLELRDRIMRAFLAVILLFIPGAYYSNQLFSWLAHPLLAQLPANATLISTSITAPFTAPLKFAFVASLVAAMPWVIYQIWAFVAPGLYRHEKRIAVPMLASAIVLFYCGMAFSYYVILPLMFKFFVATTPAGVQLMADISTYLDLVMLLLFATGAAFEVPVVVVLLVAMGVVQVEKLTRIRGYVLILVFIVSAMITPPDAVSMTIMALPMYALYEAGILFARIVARSRERRLAEEEKNNAGGSGN